MHAIDVILLPDLLYRQIVRHAQVAAPMEAVGMVGGHANGRAVVVIELPNLAGPFEFFADPFAQYRAERRLAEAGLTLLAIYHSHPGGGLQLSSADVHFARRWPCAHIVVVPDATGQGRDGLRAYRVTLSYSPKVLATFQNADLLVFMPKSNEIKPEELLNTNLDGSDESHAPLDVPIRHEVK